jgi:Restriction endonuclease
MFHTEALCRCAGEGRFLWSAGSTSAGSSYECELGGGAVRKKSVRVRFIRPGSRVDSIRSVSEIGTILRNRRIDFNGPGCETRRNLRGAIVNELSVSPQWLGLCGLWQGLLGRFSLRAGEPRFIFPVFLFLGRCRERENPLGTGVQGIKVQVKLRGGKVNAEGLLAFMAVLGDQDVGIFVSTGGFTSEAESEARTQGRRKITLVDLEGLL